MTTHLNNRKAEKTPKHWNIDYDYLVCDGLYYDYDYDVYYDSCYDDWIDYSWLISGFIINKKDGKDELQVFETDSETFYRDIELHEGYNLDDVMEDVFLDDLDLETNPQSQQYLEDLYPQLYV